ncbi:MAG: choice-of-anchor J domain-containing protein [Prevotellaceae bacterium]|nr:choice-of-anchor J domain-containing protein [Prevotellaceae bacterium]
MLKASRAALSLKDAAFNKADLTSRHAATTDSHGIITAPDAGEHKYYTREGYAYYASGQSVYLAAQSGTVEIVETADGTVYIKDIISHYSAGSWVKGTKSGNTITIPAGQPVAWNTTYGATLSVNWGDYDEEDGFGDKLPGDIVFTIDGDVISLVGSNEDHFVGVYWDDDDTFSGNADYETVWTLDAGYEPPSTTLIELPAGATVENWYAVGSDNKGTLPATAKVSFVGNEVYLSGLFAEWPTPWIMGTLEGNKVTFPTLQYLGYNSTYAVDLYSYFANVNELNGTYVPLDVLTFTYDADAKTLTMDPEQALVLNAATDRMYYLNYISELTLSADKPEVEVVKAPYTSNLTLQNEFKKYTVIDANNDGKTWSWSSSYGTYYGYSTSNEANDYLILPIELEANKNYSVTVNAASYSATYPEKFEVKVGKAATVAGLNITAIAPTTVASKEGLDFDGDFTTDGDAGVWYVAIHAISDANMWNLSVKSLTIELGAEPTAPAAPVLTATAGAEGALEVNVSVTAPTTAINGSNLSGTVDVNIYRDDEVVKSFAGQQPGATLTWKDTEVEDGASYVYYAQASNTKGTGAKSEKVSVWVGQDAPADVENVQVTGMPTGNSISLSWDAVEGLNGGYINPATVKYDITTIEVQEFWGMLFPMEGETIGSVTGQTTATVNFPVDEGEPYYGYFGVKAVVGANESDPTSWFAYALIGAPYELPIEEHFTGSALHYFWDYNENAALGVSQDGSDGDVALALTGYEAGAATFETFKLDVKSAANPTVLFDAKKGTSDTDKLTVYAITPAGETTELETVTLGDAYQTYKVVIPASLKNERWVRIGFMANITADQTNVLLDNIKILDLYQYDLSVAVDAPKSVQAGKAATITATVKNEGENAASGYTVTIKAGDETLLTETASEALAPFTTAEFTAELATTIFDDAADVTITATVTYTNDLNPDNDAAETIISVKESTAAPVTDVVAAAVEDVSSILVSWTAPDLDAVQAEEVTESFEEGTGGWTFIDADGDGFNWEYHYNTHETGTDITAHTGEGTVHSASYDNDTQRALTPDNWLVSPDAVLDGTFKFWAVGQDADYCKEHFQVYVSTESATDVSTFEPVSAEFVATGEYKEYTADLSSYAGAAGWIAIRHFNVTDEFELVVDDITFLAGTGSVEIDHFNIYLDGELVATATADEVTATLEDVADGSHTVAVSVVYTNGQESKPVEATVSVATGLNKITVVTQPVDVYTLDGKLVRKQTTSFDGLKGVYIVGGNKVLLK